MESITAIPSIDNPSPETKQDYEQQTTGWEEVAALSNNHNQFQVNIEEILGRSLPNGMLDLLVWENTRPINEIKVSRAMRAPFLRRKAKQIQHNLAISPNYELSKSEMIDLSDFFEAPVVPQEEKNAVLGYIGEDFKKYYFNHFFDEFSDKIIQTEMQKQNPTIYETPMGYEIPYRINGVPAPEYMVKTSLGQFKDFLSRDELSGAQKSDACLIFMAQYITSNEDYFKSPLITQNIAKRLAWLEQSSSEIDQAKEQWAANYDEAHLRVVESSINHEDNTSINPNLKKLILKNMPEDYNALEKSIYAYLKLCDTLSYDGIYYKDGKDQGVHLNSARVNDVDAVNNKIVCYEFTHIYESMLDSFGIKYKKHSNINQDGKFLNSHSNTTYVVDDMILFADSTRTVEFGDLVNVKLREKTNGIRCENFVKAKQKLFSDTYEKVRAHIDAESDRVAYANIIEKYNVLAKDGQLTVADKINYMFSELNQTNLTGMDLYSAEHLLETHILHSVKGITKALVVDGEKMSIQFTLSSNPENPRDTTIAIFSYDLNTKELKKEYAKEEPAEPQTDHSFTPDNSEYIEQIFGN